MANKTIRIILALVVAILSVLSWHVISAYFLNAEQVAQFEWVILILDSIIYLSIAMIVSNFLTVLVNTNIGSFRWIPPRIAPLAETIAKYGVWVVAFALVAPRWGTTMDYILGALGIVGIGVAFAAQDSIQNLLEFAKIIARVPFVEGDTITVLDITGVVEDISELETIIRTDDDHEVSVPNNVFATNPVIKHSATEGEDLEEE